MKSRTSGSKTSAGHSERRKGLTTKLVRATTVGAIAGGLVGAAIAKRKSPALGKTARKLKNWAKSAAKSPAVKYLVEDAAQRVIGSNSSKRATGKGQSVSARRK
jgi:gas vesicle protein